MVMAAAPAIPLSTVNSHTEKDCKGFLTGITFDSRRKGSTNHCFDHTPGASFSQLRVAAASCKRAYVEAHTTNDCSDPNGGYQFEMRVWNHGEACVNVDKGYGSFRLGCFTDLRDNGGLLSAPGLALLLLYFLCTLN